MCKQLVRRFVDELHEVVFPALGMNDSNDIRIIQNNTNTNNNTNNNNNPVKQKKWFVAQIHIQIGTIKPK